jgi:hypothetical protein
MRGETGVTNQAEKILMTDVQIPRLLFFFLAFRVPFPFLIFSVTYMYIWLGFIALEKIVVGQMDKGRRPLLLILINCRVPGVRNIHR